MDNDYRRAANLTVIAAGIAALLWLIFKYALGAVAPLLFGALIAAIVSPVASRLARRTGIPKKLFAAVLVLLLVVTVGFLLYRAGARLLEETKNLIERLSDSPNSVLNGEITESKLFDRLSSALERLGIDPEGLLVDTRASLLSALTSRIPDAAIGIAAGLPSALLSAVALLLTAFYLATDHERILGGLSLLLPPHWQENIPHLRKKMTATLTGYLKAYLLIMLLTFCEMLLGLSILRVRYALLMSLIIAAVDVLPVLGTGTVLIPWALYSFAVSDHSLGIGLLILYGVSLIVRQLAEPRIVGNTLGLHPLATLTSIYLGLRFLGLGGLFVGPMVALLLKGLFKPEGSAS